MSKNPRFGKSGIEYLTHVWNFYSGCHNQELGICAVKNCWAKGLVVRRPAFYPNGFEPTFYPEALLSPLHLKKPARIGVAFMGDLFGDWVDPGRKMVSSLPSGKGTIGMSLKGWVFTTIKQCPQHDFLFLTKCPRNYPAWGEFPDNAWVGATATSDGTMTTALTNLARVKAKKKWLSIEPLLGYISMKPHDLTGIDWVAIGAQTRPTVEPQLFWVKEIANACDRAGIPVWLKDNLRPLLRQNSHNIYSYPEWAGKQFAVTGDHSLAIDPHPNEPMRQLRQEFPKEGLERLK